LKIYCLSGLGVDKRAFKNLVIPGVQLIHVPWILPLEQESLSNYSKRLFEQNSFPKDYHLLGVSFGGMVAQEFAKIQKPKKLILISTIRGNHQLPTLFKISGKIGVQKLIPTSILKSANFFSYNLFGVKRQENKILLKQILKATNSKFLKWAMSAIVCWQNKEQLEAITIHGSKDKILNPISPNHLIKNGGHFMIVNKAKEIGEIIKNGL